MSNLLMYNTVGAIIDVVALIIIAFCMMSGAKKGFIKSLISTFGSFFSLILAVLLCSSVARFFENNFGWITGISGKISGILTKIFGQELMDVELGLVTEDVLSEQFNVSLFLIKTILSVKANSNIPLDTTLNQIICPVFAYYIVCIISVVILFIVFKIIFFLIGEIVKKLHSNKIIGTADSALGILFGAIKSIIIINFALMIISIIPIGFVQDLYVSIDSTIITKIVNKIDVFSLILKALASVNIADIITGIIA